MIRVLSAFVRIVGAAAAVVTATGTFAAELKSDPIRSSYSYHVQLPPCASSPFVANETAIVGTVPSATGTVRIPELGLTAPIQKSCFEFRTIVLPHSPTLVSFEIDADGLQPATWANELVLTAGQQVTFTPTLHPSSSPERNDPCPALLSRPRGGLSAAEQLHASLCPSAASGGAQLPSTGTSASAADRYAPWVVAVLAVCGLLLALCGLRLREALQTRPRSGPRG
jgi:hypothetical protein